MSVLIRGMDEIPEDGTVLMVKHDDDGKAYIKYAGMMGYSMELERIPEKHGRLVDADKLITEKGDWYTEEGTEEGFIGTVKDLVKSISTVIESEGAEK